MLIFLTASSQFVKALTDIQRNNNQKNLLANIVTYSWYSPKLIVIKGHVTFWVLYCRRIREIQSGFFVYVSSNLLSCVYLLICSTGVTPHKPLKLLGMLQQSLQLLLNIHRKKTKETNEQRPCEDCLWFFANKFLRLMSIFRSSR